MVLEGAGWDRKKFPESNLHVCGRDDTKIGVYNMERCTKRGDWKKSRIFENKTVHSCIIILFNKTI